MRQIPFTKMHGLGNDFIILDELLPKNPTPIPVNPEFAKKICDRRFGIGADQILWLRKPHDTSLDARMEIYNADGSIAEMCGNGIRAVALYLNSRSSQPKPVAKIETLGGIKQVRILNHDQVEVDMGIPTFRPVGEDIKINALPTLQFHEVSVGNPHAVFFVNDLAKTPAAEIGPQVEKHARFPQRTNVEFVEVQGRKRIKILVWERGAGLTMACGTGACAAAVASIGTDKTEQALEVVLPGGSLQISWKPGQNSVWMTGPAQEVFTGVFSYPH